MSELSGRVSNTININNNKIIIYMDIYIYKLLGYKEMWGNHSDEVGWDAKDGGMVLDDGV